MGVLKRSATDSADADKGKAKGKKQPKTWIGRQIHYWMPVFIVLAVLLPGRSVVADWNDVPSGSMRPTILEGDRIYVNKLAFGLRVPFTKIWIIQWGAPERGDIITFASPKDGTRLVKRVVGVPGDRLSMVDSRIYLNGNMIEYDATEGPSMMRLPDGTRVPIEHYEEKVDGVSHPIILTPALNSTRNFDEIVIPEGKFFVMGDNRDQSFDSRYFHFVDRSLIYGRTGLVLLSLDPEKSYKPRFGRWFSKLP